MQNLLVVFLVCSDGQEGVCVLGALAIVKLTPIPGFLGISEFLTLFCVFGLVGWLVRIAYCVWRDGTMLKFLRGFHVVIVLKGC